MLNVGTPELLVILVVALLVLGPTRLPDAMRQVGKAVGELRRLSSGFQAELRDAMQEPVESGPSVISPPASKSEPTDAQSTEQDGVEQDGVEREGVEREGVERNGDAAAHQGGDAAPSPPA